MDTDAGEARRLRYIRIGRMLAIALTFIAALMMAFTKETDESYSYSSITGVAVSTYISVKSSDSSSFMYFVIANSIVFLYSLVSTGLSFIKKQSARLEIPLTIADLLAMILLFTGNAAAAATEAVAWNGVPHYGWNKLCNITTNFCGIATTANVLSSLAAAFYFAMVVITLINIHRRTQA